MSSNFFPLAYRLRPLINTQKLLRDNISIYWAKSLLNFDGTIKYENFTALNEFIYTLEDITNTKSSIYGSTVYEDVFFDCAVDENIVLPKPYQRRIDLSFCCLSNSYKSHFDLKFNL